MASDIQRGTRGLSAGDWVRIKRLNGARGNMLYAYGPTSPPPDPNPYKGVINPPARSEPASGRRVYTEFGTSKIRRPASSWTDYRASQTADYVLESTLGACETNPGIVRTLTINRICRCGTTSAISHNEICVKCSK